MNNNNLPMYKQIKNKIKISIDNEEHLAGEAILSERELAKKYGVNRMTVKKAIQSLIEDGILYSMPGSGTFVCKKDRNFMVGIFDDQSFSSISSKLQASGIKGVNKLVSKGIINKSISISNKLNIDSNEDIFFLVRQRLNNNSKVITLEYFYTPKKYFNDIEKYDFTRVSLYDYMEKQALKPVSFERKMSIEPAPKSIANLLEIPKNQFIYCFEFIGYTKDKQIIEYTKSYIDTNTINFEYKLSK